MAAKGFNSITWNQVCRPKYCGGLGLHSIYAMNTALLSKLNWFLTQDANKLWVKILKAKYFPYDSIMFCPIKRNCLRLWSTVLSKRSTFAKGLCFRVG